MKHNLAPSLLVLDEAASESSTDSESEWKFVPRGRPMRNAYTRERLNTRNSGSATLMSSSHSDKNIDIDLVLSKNVESAIEILSSILESESFFSRYAKHLDDIVSIKGLGIGSISTSKSALFQFAFLVICHRRVADSHKEPTLFYDPIVTPSEAVVIESFGILALDSSPVRVHTDHYTLWYMPHCDRTLYETVLYDTRTHLRRTLFISNKFSYYGELFPGTWDKICAVSIEVPMLVLEADYDRYNELMERRERLTLFKPKRAMKSELIPFEAFSDLAFVRITSDCIDSIVSEPEWDRGNGTS